jgi:hypothetical protein
MRAHEEETVAPFAPGNNSHSGNPDQLDRAGQTILQLLIRPLVLRRRTTDTRSKRPKDFRISCALPRTELRS